MRLLFVSLSVLISLLIFSCNTNEPPINQTLSLKLEDVSCTEAWIQFSSTNIQIPNNISLLVNGSVKKTITLNTQDSLLYIDSLLPNQTYKIKAILNATNNPQPTNNEVELTTLDTTSHNFTWQKFTFGEHSSSIFYDVAIINANNIWAVGTIYMNDSLGNVDQEQYAIAHWNGIKWDLMKLRFNCRIYYPDCGPITTLITSAYSIFASNEKDVWVAASSVHHFNGSSWTEEAGILGSGDAYKIWGSDNELWFVGSNGFISHRGPTGIWSKIENNSVLPITDIYGVINPANNSKEIICVASEALTNSGVGVMKINDDNSIKYINSSGLKWSISSVWFLSVYKYFIVGNGLFTNMNIGKSNWLDLNENRSITDNYMDFIRGTNFNNIIVVGAFGEILHFNGQTWKSLKDSQTLLINGSYYRVAIKDNIVVAVGYDGKNGIILLGNQQ